MIADNTHPIRVMVVDDHLVVRQGFATMLRAYPDILLVADARNGEEALAACAKYAPEVILMDMVMPQMSGVETIRQIRKSFSKVQIIGMTSYSEDKQLVQAATEAGAIGYLFKDVSVAELVYAIRSVHAGQTSLSPQATWLLIQAKAQHDPTEFKLSDREQEVLRLMGKGLSNLEISQQLVVSIATVKFHVSSILRKMRASSRTEAVTLAYRYKLIQ